jgi:hypothetical protein
MSVHLHALRVSLISRDFDYDQILVVFTTVVEKTLQNLEGSALLRTLREPNSLRRPPILIAEGFHPQSLFSSYSNVSRNIRCTLSLSLNLTPWSSSPGQD